MDNHKTWIYVLIVVSLSGVRAPEVCISMPATNIRCPNGRVIEVLRVRLATARFSCSEPMCSAVESTDIGRCSGHQQCRLSYSYFALMGSSLVDGYGRPCTYISPRYALISYICVYPATTTTTSSTVASTSSTRDNGIPPEVVPVIVVLVILVQVVGIYFCSRRTKSAPTTTNELVPVNANTVNVAPDPDEDTTPPPLCELVVSPEWRHMEPSTPFRQKAAPTTTNQLVPVNANPVYVAPDPDEDTTPPPPYELVVSPEWRHMEPSAPFNPDYM